MENILKQLPKKAKDKEKENRKKEKLEATLRAVTPEEVQYHIN